MIRWFVSDLNGSAGCVYEKMKYEDPIFKPSANSAISYFKFLNYFKGLAIKTSEDNNCIIDLNGSAGCV